VLAASSSCRADATFCPATASMSRTASLIWVVAAACWSDDAAICSAASAEDAAD